MPDALPEPVCVEGRICFGVQYYLTEEDALAFAKFIRARGDRYNGGWLDGHPCGRDHSFDRTVDGVRWYAVTTR